MTIDVIDRAKVNNAFETCCRLASMANEPRPANVNWGRVYKTNDGNFRLVCELGKSKRDFMTAFVERVEIVG